ncbi:MAG: hypothetical protein U0736_21955 [Gemmataceae bacterium]
MPRRSKRTRELTRRINVTALGVDSNYEPITRAACEYRETNVYPYLESKGFQVIKLQGPLARRHYVAPEARKPGVDYLTGVGHGLDDLYTGDHGAVIFRTGDYHPDEANGKIVHLLSCQTARGLGRDFVTNGARAYFGYDENFTFTMAEKDVFFECDAEIDRAFADGLTAARVYDRVRTLYDQRIAELRSAGKLRQAATLEFDRDHLRCPSSGGLAWGDTQAKLH